MHPPPGANSACRHAFTLIAAGDLHNQLAVLGELQELVIGNRLESGQAIRRTIVSAEPHKTFVVDNVGLHRGISLIGYSSLNA